MLNVALTAITAAVVGVILNLAVWFGMHLIFDDIRTISGLGLSIELPVLASVIFAALFLVLAGTSVYGLSISRK